MRTIDRTPRKVALIVSITTLIFILLCASTHGYSQKACNDHIKPGLAVGAYSSGNGQGTSYEFLGSIRSHRSTIMAGPSFQKATRSLNGAKIWYSYSVTGVEPSCKRYGYGQDEIGTELAFFASVGYYNKASLSANTIRMEGDLTQEMHDHYTSLRFNTVEIAMGMGFNFRLTEGFRLRTFVGISYYDHLDFNQVMYHSKNGAVLTTGIGIMFNK